MTDLLPLTPLGATTPKIDTIGGLTITEVTDRAIASVATLKGQESALEAAYKSLGRGSLPGVSSAIEKEGRLTIWSSAQEWLVDEDLNAHPNWSLELAETLGATAAVTEQSGAWCRFVVSGAGDYDFFERLCALDIRKMKAGDALRTTIHHLNCIVVCNEKDWLVTGPASTAEDLHHALVLAARSVA